MFISSWPQSCTFSLQHWVLGVGTSISRLKTVNNNVTILGRDYKLHKYIPLNISLLNFLLAWSPKCPRPIQSHPTQEELWQRENQSGTNCNLKYLIFEHFAIKNKVWPQALITRAPSKDLKRAHAREKSCSLSFLDSLKFHLS